MKKSEIITEKIKKQQAIAASRTLRTALGDLLQYTADGKMLRRLNNRLIDIFRRKDSYGKGDHNVVNAGLEWLRGFEFNERKRFSCTLYSRRIASVDRMSGQLKLVISGFNPQVYLYIPKSSTHFKLYTVALEIDFENRQFVTSILKTPLISQHSIYIGTITHTHTLSPNSTNVLMLLQGIECCMVVNRRQHQLHTGNALAIVKVSVAGE